MANFGAGAALAVAKVRPDSLGPWVRELSNGEGEIFKSVDQSKMSKGFAGCAICGKVFQDTNLLDGRTEVKVLQCFHSVCSECLQGILADTSQEDFVCPVCQFSQSKRVLHAFLPNFEVHSIMDSHQITSSAFTCEECVNGLKAEAYCEECHMHMCEACVKQHRRAKATFRHPLRSTVDYSRITSSSAAESRGRHMPAAVAAQAAAAAAAAAAATAVSPEPQYVHRAQYCATHRAFRYDFYCEDCEALICKQCVVESHQLHSYRLPSAAMLTRHRARIQEVIDQLCDMLFDAQGMTEQVRIGMDLAETSAAKAVSDLDQYFDQLSQACMVRCDNLKQSMRKRVSDETNGIEAAKSFYSSALVDIWRKTDFLEKALERGNDIEVLKIKGQLFHQHQQQLRRWHQLAETSLASRLNSGQRPSPSMSQEDVRRKLAGFGVVEVHSENAGFPRSDRDQSRLLPRPQERKALQTRQHRMSWADLVSCDSSADEACKNRDADAWFGSLPVVMLKE